MSHPPPSDEPTNTTVHLLTHAASGAAGTVLSSLATYPLDLASTRLKVQRQLRRAATAGDDDDGAHHDAPRSYSGTWDALTSIYAHEGGVRGLFAGLGAEVGKGAVEAGLWFLFYEWLRTWRLAAGRTTDGQQRQHLRALEELAVGAVAGACAKALTTPVSNVVTHKQAARMLDASSNGSQRRSAGADASFCETLAALRQERGLRGLWAGYSATLVLTLNPSITFFLQQTLKRALVPRERWKEPGTGTTFLLAAVSKVVATAMMYPFQIAKARVQVAVPWEKEGSGPVKGGGSLNLLRNTVFATVLGIARTDGVGALYDGIGGELVKGFFNHGTTMLSKDVIHGFILQLYFAILAALKRYPQLETRLSERMRQARGQIRERWLRASSSGISQARRGADYVKHAVDSDGRTAVDLLRASRRLADS